MKTVKLLFGILLLNMVIGVSTAIAAPDDTPHPFYAGKTLAHPIISGARDSSALLVFIQENQVVKGYYCFCSEEDNSADHLPHLLGTFPDSTIESVFYADVDQAGQITLVLSKSHGKFALRGWRYIEDGSYIPVLSLQPVLDKLVRENKDLNATSIKRALAKLPPYDYSAQYPKFDNHDFDNIDFTQGDVVGWYLDDGTPSHAAKQPADNVYAYKKTFAEKDGLFLTVTFRRVEDSATPGFRATAISWQTDPAKFSGSENGPYVYYSPQYGLVKGFFLHGVPDGKWTTVGENFSNSGSYVAGQQQGQWTISDGQETATGLMKNDEREGRWEIADGMDGNTPELSGFDTYLNGQRHGPSERRLAGVLRSKGDYVDDQPEGMWITENGEGPFVKGVANGMWKLKTADGEIQQVELIAGVKQGELRWSDKQGRLTQLIHYKDNLPHGVYQKFNAAGKMVYQADYVMGKLEGREIEYYDDGTTVRADRGYRNGELDGPNIYNFPDGKPKSVSTYDRGYEVGLMQEFTATGVKITERNYCPLSMSGRGYCGKQQTFNPDGTPLTETDYLFNRQQTNNTWYANGQRQDETRIGTDDSYTQISYYPNGQMQCISRAQGFKPLVVDGKEYKDYQGALRQGESACYYPDGKVKSSGVWKDGRLTTGCETRFDENGKQTAPGPKGCVIPKWEYEQ